LIGLSGAKLASVGSLGRGEFVDEARQGQLPRSVWLRRLLLFARGFLPVAARQCGRGRYRKTESCKSQIAIRVGST